MLFGFKKRHFIPFLILSLLLHFVFVYFVRDPLSSIEIKKTKPLPVFFKLAQPEKLPNQIVDIPKPAQEQRPDQPSAQALYDQSVTDETVQRPQPTPIKPVTPQEQPRTAKKPETTKKPIKPEVTPAKKFEELYGKKAASEPTEHIPGMPEARETVAQNQPRDDFLPHYKYGNRTYVNTLANPHIGYYVELKRKFRLTFNPAPHLRGYTTAVAQGQVNVVLGVSVDRNGQLASLVTLRSSGIPSFDSEGRRTITDSAPFSAPPAHLLGPDGMLHMAWTFIVYM